MNDEPHMMRRGLLSIVGIGPGDEGDMSTRCIEALKKADVIVGYTRYIESVRRFTVNKEIHTTGMKREIERSKIAVDMARKGRQVCIVSGGDPGVYGIAGLVLELVTESDSDLFHIEIVPGITAATAAASCLGAPLTHDFCVISLSDLLTERPLIEKRLKMAAAGDFVTVLYNPKSHSRTELLRSVPDIFLPYRSSDTPVGIVCNAGRTQEKRILCTLASLLDHEDEIGMDTTVIIGSSTSYQRLSYMLTPRGYVFDGKL